MLKWIGVGISAVGYLMAIGGGVLLYRNAAPDLGDGGLFVRMTDFDGVQLVAEREYNEEAGRISLRQKHTKRGFLLVTVGCALQLFGTVASAFGSI